MGRSKIDQVLPSICLVTMCLAGPVPKAIRGRSFLEGVGGAVGFSTSPASVIQSEQHSQSAYDKGAHQAVSSSGKNNVTYNQGTQTGNQFHQKESEGSKESFAHSASNAFNQGAGNFLQSGNFNQVARLGDFSHLFQSAGFPGFQPGVVVVPHVPFGVAFSADNLQQGSASSGQAQGQAVWSFNQGQSSVDSSGKKETFANKESFGTQAAADAAIGTVQSGHAQLSQAGHHEKGHQLDNASQGISTQLPTSSEPVLSGSTLALAGAAVDATAAAAAQPQPHTFPLPQISFAISPLASIRGERFSNGSLENAEISTTNSTAYNTGSAKSNSFSTKESFSDKKSFADEDKTSHSQAHQQGSHSEDGSGSRFEHRESEQHLVTGDH